MSFGSIKLRAAQALGVVPRNIQLGDRIFIGGIWDYTGTLEEVSAFGVTLSAAAKVLHTMPPGDRGKRGEKREFKDSIAETMDYPKEERICVLWHALDHVRRYVP